MPTSHKINQLGNTLIAVLIACIFLAAITEVVIVIYNRHKETNSINAVTLNQPSKTKAPSMVPPVQVNKIASSTSATSTSTASTVTISGLGIQITVPASLKDLTYSISTNSMGAKVGSFSTQTISSEIPSCAATSGTGAFDTIEVENGNFNSSSNPSAVLIKQYSSYFVAYVYPKGPCATNLTTSEQTLLDSSSQDFTNALQSVQAKT